jgi:hypothetical protein
MYMTLLFDPRFFVALSGIGGLASTCEAHRSRQFHCHSRCFFLSGTPGDGLCLCFLPEMWHKRLMLRHWHALLKAGFCIMHSWGESGRGLLTAIEAKGPLRDPEVFADPRSKDWAATQYFHQDGGILQGEHHAEGCEGGTGVVACWSPLIHLEMMDCSSPSWYCPFILVGTWTTLSIPEG